MNRNEQKFYSDVTRATNALEEIAKQLSKITEIPKDTSSILNEDELDSYDASSDYQESTLKDLIEKSNMFNEDPELQGFKNLAREIIEPEANPFDDIINEVKHRSTRLANISDSLDSFFSIRKNCTTDSTSASTNYIKNSTRNFPSTPRNCSNYLYGEITQLMLEFVRLNPGCSFTDINRFNQEFTHENKFDKVSHRGHFSHHLVNLRVPKIRRCDAILREDLTDGVKEQWIEKRKTVNGGSIGYYYRENC